MLHSYECSFDVDEWQGVAVVTVRVTLYVLPSCPSGCFYLVTTISHTSDWWENKQRQIFPLFLTIHSLFIRNGQNTEGSGLCVCFSHGTAGIREREWCVLCCVVLCVCALVPRVLVCEEGLPLADGALINTWALSSQHHSQVSPRKPSQDQAPGTCAQGEEEQTITHRLHT